jgi:hypothetical protein
MKVFHATALLTLSFAAASAQAVLTVVPNQFAAAEGNSSSSSLFQTGAASMQTMYTESFLAAAGITPGAVIHGVAYRRNTGGTTGPAGATTIADYNIFLSRTFDAPLSMTNTFANNVVGPQVQVHSGAITFAANSFPGGGTPNAFGPIVDFQTDYVYTGGSLLFEFRRGVRTGDLTSNNTDVDNTAGTQAGARWLFNTSGNTAVTGTLSNGGHIFQLDYTPVPEPATMTALALGGLAMLRRKRSK